MSVSRRHPHGQAPSDLPAAERPSKSQRKRDAHAAQALGAQLTTVRDDVLVRLPISEELIAAVRMAREIRSHEGRRRQVQLIGKLMRDADGEAIAAALADETRGQRTDVAILHAAERWRERILQDPRVLANWYAEFPDSRAAVEPLVPRAQAELAAGAPARAFRDLFRKLRAALEQAAQKDSSQAETP